MTDKISNLFKLAEFNYSIDLQRAVDKLKPSERRVLLLVYMIGLTFEEAGSELGLSTKEAHRYAVNAVKKIRIYFAMDGEKNRTHGT